MAIRDLCSFDAMVTADLDERFTSIGTTPVISAGNGRGSTASVRGSASSASLTKLGLSPHATYGVAFSFRLTALPAGAAQPIIQLLDDSSGQAQCSLMIDSAGRVVVIRGTSTAFTLGTSVAAAIFPNVQHHIQFMATISDTVGTYEVRVDGVTVLTGSGADTKASTTTSFVGGYIISPASSGNTDIDDLYVWDGSGSTNTGFPGDVRVLSALPSGAGASTGWAPSTGANYAAVDDSSPNTTDYVAGDGTDKDTYAFADIVGSGTVRGALLSAYATKAAEGPARGIKGVCRSSSTEGLSTEVVLGVGYRYWLQAVYEQDPATAAAWASLAALNAAEWGVVVST